MGLSTEILYPCTTVPKAAVKGSHHLSSLVSCWESCIYLNPTLINHSAHAPEFFWCASWLCFLVLLTLSLSLSLDADKHLLMDWTIALWTCVQGAIVGSILVCLPFPGHRVWDPLVGGTRRTWTSQMETGGHHSLLRQEQECFHIPTPFLIQVIGLKQFLSPVGAPVSWLC